MRPAHLHCRRAGAHQRASATRTVIPVRFAMLEAADQGKAHLRSLPAAPLGWAGSFSLKLEIRVDERVIGGGFRALGYRRKSFLAGRREFLDIVHTRPLDTRGLELGAQGAGNENVIDLIELAFE